MTRARGESLAAADRERMSQLATIVSGQRRRLELVDYGRAEEDCERLAGALLAEVGARELARFDFRAMPRGGLIVLGMLAYQLDLAADRLAGGPPRGPLILVDDCALTGARFAAALRASAAPEVIFVHLRSPAGLRAAIEQREPRVRRCLAAQDLVDRSVSMAESERARWLAGWQQRLGPDRYYFGDVDPVAFAWSEPDRLLWNSASGRLEAGWRLASPSECLRTRARLGPPPVEPAERRWKAAPAVASAEVGDHVWLCDARSGEVVALEGSAAAMWRRLGRHGDPRLAAVELAAEYDVEPAALRSDLDAFAQGLVERGLLEAVVPTVDEHEPGRAGTDREP